MEPSCGWICNPPIVWLGDVTVGKILDRIEKPTRCFRFDPVFGSNNHPLFGPLSIMIIAEHSIVVGVTTVVWHLGTRVGTPTSIVLLRGERYICVIWLMQKRRCLGDNVLAMTPEFDRFAAFPRSSSKSGPVVTLQMLFSRSHRSASQ